MLAINMNIFTLLFLTLLSSAAPIPLPNTKNNLYGDPNDPSTYGPPTNYPAPGAGGIYDSNDPSLSPYGSDPNNDPSLDPYSDPNAPYSTSLYSSSAIPGPAVDPYSYSTGISNPSFDPTNQLTEYQREKLEQQAEHNDMERTRNRYIKNIGIAGVILGAAKVLRGK